LRFLFTCVIFFATNYASAQLVVSGSVLDKSKINYVEGVRVFSTGGKIAITDSLGHYSINVNKTDSIYFVYNAKPTQKFAINNIPNTYQFDISLHLNVQSRYSVMKEVVVYSKNYKQDSAENRQTYAEVFNFHKPRFETSIVPGGGVGLDANELFNLFRFKRNKRLKKFQERLEADEQERYVNYRFNKTFVKRITQLKAANLDTFMVWYRPSFLFTIEASEVDFNQYILNCMYQYKRIIGLGEAKKEDE
jgi:plasmid maintenance system killer protein